MLTRKFFLLIIPVLLLFALIDYVVVNHLVIGKFDRLERREAIKNGQRVLDAIERELHHLMSLCEDWSYWDDTFEFMVTHNQSYIESNLVPQTHIDNEINLFMLINTDGSVLLKKNVDLETLENIAVAEFDLNSYPPDHFLISRGKGDIQSGIVHTSAGLFLIAKAPILTSLKTGPYNGTMIMGRLFDGNYQDILCGQTRMRFSVNPGDIDQISSIRENARHEGDNFVIDYNGPDTLNLLGRLDTINGVDYYIEASLNRDFMKEGRRTVTMLYISLMVVSIIILFVLMIGIQFLVIRPIKRLKEHALLIAHKQETCTRLYPNRKDEIGVLAQEFDQVFDRLFETRSRLLESSYKSGLAEMASNFLHNLRNSLTPLMGEIQGIRYACRNLDFEKYKKAHEELMREDLDPERRKKIREYLLLLDRQYFETMDDINLEFNTLDEYRQNIEKLLDTQSKWTSAKPVVEPMKQSEIGKEIQSFLSPSLRRKLTLSVHNEEKKDKTIRTYRVTLLMILSRLLEYIVESRMDSGDLRIVILTKRMVHDEKPILSIRVMMPQTMHPIEGSISVFAEGSTDTTKSLTNELIWCTNTASVIGAGLRIEQSEDGLTSYFLLQVPIIEQAGSE